jgi:hypothetical protein
MELEVAQGVAMTFSAYLNGLHHQIARSADVPDDLPVHGMRNRTMSGPRPGSIRGPPEELGQWRDESS